MNSWIEGALQGKPEAFEQLVSQYRGMALTVAYQKLQDAHAAEDVVQEAFTEAFGNLVKLEKPEAFPGWFKVIVERQCYRWLRRKRHTVVPMQELDEVYQEEDQKYNPETQAMQKSYRRRYVVPLLNCHPRCRSWLTCFIFKVTHFKKYQSSLGLTCRR